jgi:hypothetical protein
MPATTANALKSLVEGLGLGLSAFRDGGSESAVLPYVTIMEQIALVPDALEDGAASTVLETAQVDLWQAWRSPAVTGDVVEDYTLAPALEKGLHGARLALIGTAVTYAVLVRGAIRTLEREENVVHTALTVEIFRQL